MPMNKIYQYQRNQLFFKFTNCVCGPNDDIIIPKDQHTDWEVGMIYGKKFLMSVKIKALYLGFLVNDVRKKFKNKGLTWDMKG